MAILFKDTTFVKSATREAHYPKSQQPEVAFVGRSNVGKSSLLNDLFNRSIAKVSNTPGKTQLINFFTSDDAISWVDLPGYGFARVPVEVRKKWGPMIQEYFDKRSQLKLILLLLDIRRVPNEDDQRVLEWIRHYNIPHILVLTKVDKVKAQEKKVNTQMILKDLNAIDTPYVHYSTKKKQGRKELIHLIEKGLNA